jgi:hypothetical protein
MELKHTKKVKIKGTFQPTVGQKVPDSGGIVALYLYPLRCETFQPLYPLE